MNSNNIVQKLWNYCNVLRDDGMSYGDYVEQGKVSKERDTVERGDFWTTTSNKQLNFAQHVKTLLRQNGRAAVVVPDNVLFEGGAGETIRRKLLHECDVHTLLRLPTGLFYAQGVKANVLFFNKKPASETPRTRKLWIYDLRTSKHFTLKTKTLQREDLDEFVECCKPGKRHERVPAWAPMDSGSGAGTTGDKAAASENGSGATEQGRWRAYEYDELIARDKVGLDIFWLRDDSRIQSSASNSERKCTWPLYSGRYRRFLQRTLLICSQLRYYRS